MDSENTLRRMRKIVRFPRLLSIILLFGGTLSAPAYAAPPEIGITNLQLVSSKRVSRVVYEYTFKVVLYNKGGDATNVVAAIGSTPEQLEVQDGEVTFGTVPQEQYATSVDTITVRHDRTKPFTQSMISWSFNYSASALTSLAGMPADPALTATKDFYSGDSVAETELSDHPDLGPVARTKLTLVMHDNATIAQVNNVLASANAVVTSMVSGLSIYGLRIPDTGSPAALDSLIATIKAMPGVEMVLPVTTLKTDALPLNPGLGSDPNKLSKIGVIDHHLAAKAHGVWNARKALKDRQAFAPTIFIADHFGEGAPQNALWSFKGTVQSDYAANTGEAAEHGYEVASVIGANFGGATSDEALVTGFYPEPLTLRAQDAIKPPPYFWPITYVLGWDFKSQMIKKLAAITENGKKAVLNLSLGTCDPLNISYCLTVKYLDDIQNKASIWRKSILKKNLNQRVFISVASGNEAPIPAEDDGSYQRALLGPLNGGVAPLDNGLVVESFATTFSPGSSSTISSGCRAWYANIGGHIGGFGGVLNLGLPVEVLGHPTGNAVARQGTSYAAPQIAALAATIWTLNPTLTPQQVRMLITYTAASAPCGETTNVVHAYRAVLAVDHPHRKGHAPVREAILDVVDTQGNENPDGKFTVHDLKKFLQQLDLGDKAIAQYGYKADYSRYDLNGDGYTGGTASAAFNLDEPFDFNNFSAPVNYNNVDQTIEGQNIQFNETAMTDLKVLIYYAYSNLFDDEGLPSERTMLLLPYFHKIGLLLSNVKITWKNGTSVTATPGWYFYPDITLSSIESPKNNFLGNNGLYETGGPLYSSLIKQAAPNAVFFDVNQTQGVPYQMSGPFPSYKNASSFVAADGGRVWINATGRGKYGLYTDWEYQTRLYLGDPGANRNATQKVSIGTVPGSGNFTSTIDATGHNFDVEFSFAKAL